MFSTIASIRRIRSGGWCSIFAIIAMTERQRLSDYTCTALQLANFWQDVSRDLEKGRIYIPLDASRARLTEEDIVARRFDERYVALMKALIARTRELFRGGHAAGRRRRSNALRVDIELFSRGGLAILDAIEASGYNTLEHRPALTKWTKLGSARAARWHCDAVLAAACASSPRAAVSDAANQCGHVPATGKVIRPAATTCSEVASRPTRNAIASRARRTAASISRFSACASRSATRCARSTRSCGWWTMFPTSPAIWNRSSAAWRAGARCSMKRLPAEPTATRFFRRWRTRFRVSRFRRAIFTI